MNEDLRIISDTIVSNVAEIANVSAESNDLNWWMIIAIIEFVVIVILLLSKKTTKYDEIRNIKNKVKGEGDIDWKNIHDSIAKAEKLYKELIIKCHPDRFPLDEEKNKIATDITERLGKNKHDYKSLEALKEEAKNKLNINFSNF